MPVCQRTGKGMRVGVRVTRIQAEVIQSILQSAGVAGLPRLTQVASLVRASGGPT